MKLKTSISIIIGCSIIFLFIMLPIFLSIEKKEDSYISQFQGSNFSLLDVNNQMITEESFKGPITAIFFGFTNCPDVCPMTLGNLDQAINNLKDDKKEKFKVFLLSQSWGVLSEKIFDEEGNYSINHSSSIILLKDGKYLDRISHHAQYDDIFKALDKHLR